MTTAPRFATLKLSQINVIGVTIPADPSHPLYDERATMAPDKSLCASLAAQGQITPVRVFEDKDGALFLADGRQRYNAAAKLGWESLTATVEPLPDSTTQALGIWAANVHVGDRPDHRFEKVRRQLACGITRAEMAKAAGVTPQRIGQWLAWEKLTPAAREAVLNGSRSFDDAISKRADKAAAKGGKKKASKEDAAADAGVVFQADAEAAVEVDVQPLIKAARTLLRALEGVELSTKATSAMSNLLAEIKTLESAAG